MKIEKQNDSIIKSIKLSHLYQFIVFNIVCFFASVFFFSKEKPITNELTLNMQVQNTLVWMLVTMQQY